ncbi:MAG: bifunctional UDP-3-O-[3-hydroxymyristoyl] N-acetylglucosamine deacetylase/3-hydroxyacyl-ACP dehydratase [Pelagibacterales bacterium]|nr:bifunctional UDP-3-O-[3-hydroxymyristoyl] N-acetylglucosamine deacetylase/3-hydroxyacyl-ACP dehydratase [Pelagibacterales bacterium]
MIVLTNDNQTTIKNSVSLKGVGIHTGKEVNLTFKPTNANNGYRFKRIDLKDKPIIEANIKYVINTDRRTFLKKNNITIQTCEHVLAALVGLEIDNVIIEIDASEPPIMDGSSKYFVEALESVGKKELNEKRKEFVVRDVISYKDSKSGSEITVIPSSEYQITTMVDFGTKVLGTQNATMSSIKNFKNDISDSRTFSFLHEIEMLLNKGLIKGGDLNNAIVYVDKSLSDSTMKKLKKAFNKRDIKVTPNGILDNLTLHYPNEAARHKLLDVIGDLALIGTKIRGRVIATKPGHYINTEFARKMGSVIEEALKARNKELKIGKTPTIEGKKPIMDSNKIKEILPHRNPFLFIDEIYELNENDILGLKYLKPDEYFFKGHFPDYPIVPGVIIVEAMAQIGGILVLSKVPDPENYLTFFAKIDKVKFKNKVFPGDTIIFKCNLRNPVRRGICHMRGLAFVNDRLCAEAELTAQITKVK